MTLMNAADYAAAWNLIENKFTTVVTDENDLRVELDVLFENGELTQKEYRLIEAALDEDIG